MNKIKCNINTASTVLLVKLLISNWLYFFFRLGCLIDQFTAKNNNMRLYTILLYICVIMIVIHSYEKKKKLLAFVRFYLRPKRYCCTIQQKFILLLCYRCQFLMVCCMMYIDIQTVHIWSYISILNSFRNKQKITNH